MKSASPLYWFVLPNSRQGAPLALQLWKTSLLPWPRDPRRDAAASSIRSPARRMLVSGVRHESDADHRDGSWKAWDVPVHRGVTPAHGNQQSCRGVQSTREVSRFRCRPLSDAHPRKNVVKVHLDSFPPPAKRRLSTAPRRRSALDQPGRRKAAAGSGLYDDNCRDVLGPSIRPVPLPYSCVTPRTAGVLPQAKTRA
jgi:hypothetical protein